MRVVQVQDSYIDADRVEAVMATHKDNVGGESNGCTVVMHSGFEFTATLSAREVKDIIYANV